MLPPSTPPGPAADRELRDEKSAVAAVKVLREEILGEMGSIQGAVVMH